MPNTTPNLNLYQPDENETGWADEVNDNFDKLDTSSGTEHNTDGTHKADVIDSTNIDWGTGPNQVNTDDIPEGTTNKFQSDDIVEGDTGIAQINFDTDNGEPTLDEGELAYNSADRTLDFGLGNGVTLNVGQETFANVTNQTGSAFADGKPLMFAGTVGASGKLLGQLAIADGSIPPEYTIGITTESITDGADGKATTYGRVKGIQTDGINYGETWSDGDLIYISPTTAGALTNVKPNAPDRCILVAAVVNAHATTGTFLVRPTFNPKFTDLDDVNGTPLTVDGQMAIWDQTNKYFDFTENINNFYKMLGSVGQTLYFSASNVLSATSTLFNDVANKVIKNADVEVTDSGTGTAWDVRDIQTQHFYLDDNAPTTVILDNESTTNGTLGGGQNTEDRTTTGKIISGINLDGSNDCIDTGIIPNFTTDVDICFWYKADTTSNANKALMGADTSGNDRFYFYVTGSNRLYIALGDAADFCGLETIDDTDWHHYRVKFTASTKIVLVYRDQVQIGTITPTTIDAGTNNLQLGCMGVTPGNFADGTFDDYRYMVGNMSADDYDGVYASGDGTQDDFAAGGFLPLSDVLAISDGVNPLRSDFITPDDHGIVTDGKLEAQGDAYLGADLTVVGDLAVDTDLLVTDSVAGTVSVTGDLSVVDGTEALNDVFTSDANGKGSWKTPMVDVPLSIGMYDPDPNRSSESNFSGGLLALATGQPLDSTPTNIVISKGIGKVMIVLNAGSDFTGSITVTGETIDRNTGASTPADTEVITTDALSTDTSDTDTNGNTRHAFSGAYITSKWFTGSVTLSTTDTTLTDVDVYHVSFEQFDDSTDLVIDTFDANIYSTNVAAEFDAYLYCLIVTNSKCSITRCGSLHLGADGEAAIVNRYWRLRRGNIGTQLDGTKDGVWVDVHYSNAPAYIEDVTVKVWATKTIGLDLT